MAPKRSVKGLTSSERALADLGKDLRSRATPAILLSKPKRSSTSNRVPAPLAKCDGCDIIKKNVSKKAQKYLFVFPGGMSFTQGAKVGTLTGLDTPTPSLYVEFPQGRVRLRGTLVYPRNAWLGLKGGGGKKPVRCQEVFETLVVFSEWSWVGKKGEDTEDIPDEMWGDSNDAEEVKKVQLLQDAEQEKRDHVDNGAKKDGEVATVGILSGDAENEIGVVGKDDGDSQALRVQPQRKKRKKISYSDLFDEDSSATDAAVPASDSENEDSPWD